MLKSLSIRNFALIESVEIEFETGLNIITGETGAGKSIIIDALSLILGNRASADEIRKGSEKCTVEGVFAISSNKRVQALLLELELESGEDLILRREISIKGQSRCFVNDSPVQLSILKSMGDVLVDLHGQHEHQSLLRTETHISLLDDYGNLASMIEEYQKYRQVLSDLFEEQKDLRSREQQLKEKKDLYEFQIKEIDAVDPREGEEDKLESELRILENSEKLFSATSELYQTLYEADGAVYDALVKARNRLEDLASIDPAFEESQKECSSAAAIIGEITKFIQQYNSKIEFNPERLEEIRERLGALTLLKKKYGGSVESVRAYRESIGREFELAEHFDVELAAISAKIGSGRKECSAAAERLSTKRRELSPRINRLVSQELGKLGIPNGRFEVRIETKPILPKQANRITEAFVKLGKEEFESNQGGIDFVEFFLSTNAGEELKPLVKVASGGEISRIMLAMKTILAKSERLPLLIFDEIDVGISGRIGQAVGKSLHALAQFHQIIAITHLPQIAGLADCHFVVEKMETKERTTTRLRKLDWEERVKEVAKLMSGEEITEAGLQGARQLMEQR